MTSVPIPLPIVHRMIADAINRDDGVNQFGHELLIGGYERRFQKGRMTGEWIIFAKVDEASYYLTLGAHAEGDDKILDRIKACAAEFPEITPLLV